MDQADGEFVSQVNATDNDLIRFMAPRRAEKAGGVLRGAQSLRISWRKNWKDFTQLQTVRLKPLYRSIIITNFRYFLILLLIASKQGCQRYRYLRIIIVFINSLNVNICI